MSTAQQFGDYYYDSRYSPPVSPKSLPHGYKRKASTQDDELERNSLISNSFKKLRLNSAKRASGASAVDIPPIGIAYRSLSPQQSSPSYHEHVPGRDLSYLPDATGGDDDDIGIMSVDDTADRIWVHDLDAEIAEIEAEEARNRNGIQLMETGGDSSKIPQYLLRKNPSPDEAPSNMQMILYKDPISISVPEEQDAVRKTIIEARRRMREKQAESRLRELFPATLDAGDQIGSLHDNHDDEEDSMDID